MSNYKFLFCDNLSPFLQKLLQLTIRISVYYLIIWNIALLWNSSIKTILTTLSLCLSYLWKFSHRLFWPRIITFPKFLGWFSGKIVIAFDFLNENTKLNCNPSTIHDYSPLFRLLINIPFHLNLSNPIFFRNKCEFLYNI